MADLGPNWSSSRLIAINYLEITIKTSLYYGEKDFFVATYVCFLSADTGQYERQPEVAFCFMYVWSKTQTINVKEGCTDTPSSM
jgi:hypothetical protein